MAGRRKITNARDHLLAFGLDHAGLACCDDGQDAVFIHPIVRPPASFDGWEILVAAPREDIGGVRKARLPALLDQPRIPSDMVGMDMRDQDIVDLPRCDAGGSEPFEVRRVEMIEEGLRAGLAVADPGVDQDRRSWRPDQPAMHTGRNALPQALRRAWRKSPLLARNQFRPPVRTQARRGRHLDRCLAHARDRHLADAIDARCLRHLTTPASQCRPAGLAAAQGSPAVSRAASAVAQAASSASPFAVEALRASPATPDGVRSAKVRNVFSDGSSDAVMSKSGPCASLSRAAFTSSGWMAIIIEVSASQACITPFWSSRMPACAACPSMK